MKAIERFFKYLDYKGIKPTRFEKDAGLSNGYLGTQRRRFADLGEGVIKQLIDNCLDLNPLWLITGEGEMIKRAFVDIPITKVIADIETRPRIPLNAAAGSLSICLDGIAQNQCEQIPVIGAFTRYDFTIMVRGESMEPNFFSGDELAGLYIKNTSFIQWGRSHILDTAQGIIVKNIYDADDAILCKSENPRYSDFVIPKTEVYNIALVIGMIRRY